MATRMENEKYQVEFVAAVEMEVKDRMEKDPQKYEDAAEDYRSFVISHGKTPLEEMTPKAFAKKEVAIEALANEAYEGIEIQGLDTQALTWFYAAQEGLVYPFEASSNNPDAKDAIRKNIEELTKGKGFGEEGKDLIIIPKVTHLGEIDFSTYETRAIMDYEKEDPYENLKT